MMHEPYGIRSISSTGIFDQTITGCGLALVRDEAKSRRVFRSADFLEAALAKAGSKAELGRILDLPSSRIADFWKERGKGQRTLSMEEGVKLCQALDLPPLRKLSEAQLVPVLKVCLRYAPRGAWSDQDVERLAQEIVIGLELQEALRTNDPGLPSGDEPRRGVQPPDKRA